jgi:hypothetical protein
LAIEAEASIAQTELAEGSTHATSQIRAAFPSISLDACEHRRDLAERPPRLSLAHTNREPTEERPDMRSTAGARSACWILAAEFAGDEPRGGG